MKHLIKLGIMDVCRFSLTVYNVVNEIEARLLTRKA
jgi:hypothetical protein